MRRRLTLLAIGLSVVAVPVVHFGLGPVEQIAVAQDESLDLVVAQPQADKSDPHELYLELVRQKLKLLTAEELARDIQALRNEIVELESHRKLRDAERQLEELIEQHPHSKAAERAKSMLNRGRERIPGVIDPNVRTFEAQDEFLPRRAPGSEYRAPTRPNRVPPPDNFERPQREERGFPPAPDRDPPRERSQPPAEDRDDLSETRDRIVPQPDDLGFSRRKI